jgi:hypothetical protein
MTDTSPREQSSVQPSNEQATEPTAEELGFRPLPLSKPRLRGRRAESPAPDNGIRLGNAGRGSDDDQSPS